MNFDWKGTLGAIAPALATALGGPMAGMAAKIAVDALGGADAGEAGNMKQVENAIASADPSIFLKLKQADAELKVRLKELGIEIEKLKVEGHRIDAADRGNARDLAKIKGMAPQIVLSSLYTIGYFWMFDAVIFSAGAIDTEAMKLGGPLIGVMTAAQIQIMNFWFGSSAGSRLKDFANGDVAAQQAANQAAWVGPSRPVAAPA